MQFPAHTEAARVEHQVRVRAFNETADVGLAESGKVFFLSPRAGITVLEGETRNEYRPGQRDRRASVELVVQPLTQRMFLESNGFKFCVHACSVEKIIN